MELSFSEDISGHTVDWANSQHDFVNSRYSGETQPPELGVGILKILPGRKANSKIDQYPHSTDEEIKVYRTPCLRSHG